MQPTRRPPGEPDRLQVPGGHVAALRPAILDRHVYFKLEIPGFPQALSERWSRSAYSSDVSLPRKPITGNSDCCARTATGHAAAAPPRSVMNSRRFIRSPQIAGVDPIILLAVGHFVRHSEYAAQFLIRVKTGKAQCEQMFSALSVRADIGLMRSASQAQSSGEGPPPKRDSRAFRALPPPRRYTAPPQRRDSTTAGLTPPA